MVSIPSNCNEALNLNTCNKCKYKAQLHEERYSFNPVASCRLNRTKRDVQ